MPPSNLSIFIIVLITYAVSTEGRFQETDCFRSYEQALDKPKGVGAMRCRALIRVFYWDSAKKQCVTGIFGGCNATPNNFATYEGCLSVAGSICHSL